MAVAGDRRCEHCGGRMDPKKVRYCSQRCRTAACRARKAPVLDLPVVPEDKSTVEAVVRELDAAGRGDTFRGRAAVALAARIDAATAVMGFAAMVKQLESTMDAALAGVKKSDSPVIRMRDELAARRGA
jgi:hypothetical protein